jgi:DNA-binding NtrC family response regulator
MPSSAVDAPAASKGAVLIVDDEEAIRESLETLLELEGYEVSSAGDASSALVALQENPADLILLDLMLPDRSGLEVVEEIRKKDVGTPIVMLTAYGSVENAVKAIKVGANDFLTKPWNNDKLLLEIEQTIRQHRLEEENQRLREELRERYSFSNIIGKSKVMQRVFDLVAQVAKSRSTVLIHGDSGTGKELIARAIHVHSPRSGKPFVAVNTGSIPIDLLESRLFGHVRGAFTGATQTQKGCFDRADGGTIFLDEVGTLGVETQAKLLRVIQEREFMPVGSTDTVKVDVRIVAATNVDLEELVAAGGFREDLYYRLNVIQINLPPLRERREDIPLLTEHFFNKYCRENGRFLDEHDCSTLRFAPQGMKILMEHRWAGNVRELENVVERAVVLATGPEVPVEALPESLLASHGISQQRLPADFKPAAGASLFEIVEEFERRLITEELEKCGWNQTECAKHLRVALSTLNQKIQRLNIDVKKKRELAHTNG